MPHSLGPGRRGRYAGRHAVGVLCGTCGGPAPVMAPAAVTKSGGDPSASPRGCRMLESLPPNDRELLQSLLRRRRYRRGEVVFHQGDPGDTLHIVRRGYLKIVVPSEAGGEGVLAVVGPGALFGEITLLDGAPRSATVIALEDVETATLGRAAFRDLLRRSPDAAEALLAAMAGTIRRLTAEVTD